MRICFIGAGNMTRFHAQAFQDIDTVECVGIYSRTKEKAAQVATELSMNIVADSIQDLHEKTNADLVVISVSIAQTQDVLIEAAKYPWKILVEKPLGHDMQSTKFLFDHFKKGNRENDIFVAFNRRFLSSTLSVLSDITDSSSPRIIKVEDRQSADEARKYGHPETVASNFMYANSIHLIDYFSLFGRGDIQDVKNHVVLDNYKMSEIIFTSGDRGIYEAFWEYPGPWAVKVTQADKRYEMAPLEHALWQDTKSREKHLFDQSDWDKNFKPGLRAQAQEAVNMLKGEDNALPTLLDAYKTTELVSKIYRQA